MVTPIWFAPRWKEEMVCTMDGRHFVIEMTMGICTVYLPTLEKWQADSPDWARDQWERIRAELTAWCERNKTPLVIEERAWVDFNPRMN